MNSTKRSWTRRSQHNEIPEHTPVPKVAGPEEAKNAHVQKLKGRDPKAKVDEKEWHAGFGGREKKLSLVLTMFLVGYSILVPRRSCDLADHCLDVM